MSISTSISFKLSLFLLFSIYREEEYKRYIYDDLWFIRKKKTCSHNFHYLITFSANFNQFRYVLEITEIETIKNISDEIFSGVLGQCPHSNACNKYDTVAMVTLHNLTSENQAIYRGRLRKQEKFSRFYARKFPAQKALYFTKCSEILVTSILIYG